ncbi:MAG TPA: hypothetical protein VLJ86_02590 [Ramlibacter sp.]|nr:hypothetical protein [Ramlibacter sp.]
MGASTSASDGKATSSSGAQAQEHAGWLRLAKWLGQPHPEANSAQKHLFDRSELQRLPLDQRANMLLALANDIERTRQDKSATPDDLRRAYEPYLHLAGAFSDAEMLPRSERQLMKDFFDVAEHLLAELEGKWCSMDAGTPRLDALLKIVNEYAVFYAEGGVVPALQIDASAQYLGWAPGATIDAAVGAAVFGGATDYPQTLAHLLHGLGSVRQRQLVQQAEAGALASGDAHKLVLARVLCAASKAPIESVKLQAELGMTQRKARDAERESVGHRQLAALSDLASAKGRHDMQKTGRPFDWGV